MIKSIKRLFKRKSESEVENLTGELTSINAYASDSRPVVLEFKMEFSDGDKQSYKFSLSNSDAEFLIQRMQYLLSGIGSIDGIDFNG